MTRNEEILRSAISGKLAVYAIYEGRKRWLCPHVLGHKGGTLHVLAYQYAGESSSKPMVPPPIPSDGPAGNWRCMDVATMRDLEVQPLGPWYTCKRHTVRQSCIDTGLVEVAD